MELASQSLAGGSMDARTNMVAGFTGRTGEILQPPLLHFLARSHAEIADDHSGVVADYVPELTKADPDNFGVSIATTDGYVYEVGDSDVPFTIQSISKAFVFALALETIGAEKVESLIGVEPSGDVFNSIRLRADNRPFNPMVNAGAHHLLRADLRHRG
jgi:glutaminase